jgi:catechol 2,3-dioxygenase-like lactoylglutathione lyase family enzyme
MSGVPGLRSVDHIAYTVPDLDEAVAFFTAHLGARVVYRDGPFRGDGDEMHDRLDVHRCATSELAMLRLGNRTNLELIQYSAPDQNRQVPANSDVGGHHVGFYVDDIDAARDYLAGIPGVRLMAGPNSVPDSAPVAGQRWLYFRTPWGMQLEITTDSRPGFYENLPGAAMVAPE